MSKDVVVTSIDDAGSSINGFQYFGNWGQGQSIPQHFGGTAEYSNTPGSRAVIFFRGTSVVYYADRQNNLVPASVLLDNLPAEIANLTSATVAYQQPVWSKNVTDGDHQLVIYHGGPVNANIMIDYVTIQSNGSPASASAGPAASVVNSSASFVNCTDPQLQLSQNNWRIVADGLFYSKASRITQTRGASFQWTFNGTAVWYFTDTGPDHANLRVRVDDIEEEPMTGYTSYPMAQRLIWSKTDLSAGTHTINITHDDTDGKYFTLDFFRYSPSDGFGSASSHKKSTSVGVIIGATIASLFLFGILFCAFLCCFKSRRSPQSAHTDDLNPPTTYPEANPSHDSSTTEPSHPYIDAQNYDPPLEHTIPMGYVIPNPAVGRYPVQMREVSGQAYNEPGTLTPAQAYVNSVRASMAGSVSDSGVGTSPPPNGHSTEDSLGPILETDESAERNTPPPYQKH